MCGIVAVIALEGLESKYVGSDAYQQKLHREIEQSLSSIAYRGPDARGKWISKDNRVGKRSSSNI